MVAAVETMMYAKSGGVPWHGLGVAVDEAPTGIDAIKLAGLDWGVAKTPIYTRLPDGTMYELEDKMATVRLSDQKVLGFVGKDYRVLQNIDAFRILDEVFRALGIEVRYETAGSLYGGRQIFITAQMPKSLKIGKKDVTDFYLFLRTGHDGYTALDIFPTSVRVVCANTANLAFSRRTYDQKDAAFGITLWHMGDVEFKIEETKRALNLSIAKFDEYSAVAKKLHAIDATPAMESEFARIVFPTIALLPEGRKSVALLPAPDPKRWVTAVPAEMFEKAQADRLAKVEIFNKVYSEEEKTLWGLYNAATGYADHQRPRAWQTAQARTTQGLFGSGAIIKDMALEGAKELAGI